MITINFNTPLINSDGTTNEEMTLSKALSELIATETEGKTLKLYGWHKELQAGKELVLDDADLEDLKKLISENKRLFIYVKGQLLECLK